MFCKTEVSLLQRSIGVASRDIFPTYHDHFSHPSLRGVSVPAVLLGDRCVRAGCPTGRQVYPCRNPAGSQWVVGSGTPIYDNAPIGTRIFFIFPHTLIGVLFQFRTEWCCVSVRSQIGSVFPGREFKWPSRTMPVGRFN